MGTNPKTDVFDEDWVLENLRYDGREVLRVWAEKLKPVCVRRFGDTKYLLFNKAYVKEAAVITFLVANSDRLRDKVEEPVTREDLLERYTYNPETGELISKLHNRPVGTTCAANYLYVNVNGKKIYVHRVIACMELGLDLKDVGRQVDHGDGNHLNNRLDNLSLGDNRENSYNQKIHRKGRELPIGVEFSRMGYRARIQVKSDKITMGLFDTVEKAWKARLQNEWALGVSRSFEAYKGASLEETLALIDKVGWKTLKETYYGEKSKNLDSATN
jgi:hypothetical protein